jgi:hypothetical protein
MKSASLSHYQTASYYPNLHVVTMFQKLEKCAAANSHQKNIGNFDEQTI